MPEPGRVFDMKNLPKEPLAPIEYGEGGRLKGKDTSIGYAGATSSTKAGRERSVSIWLRTLNEDQTSALIDYATQLETFMGDKVYYSQERFRHKLIRHGSEKASKELLERIIGPPAVSGMITPYDIYWAARYARLFTEYTEEGNQKDAILKLMSKKFRMDHVAFCNKSKRKDMAQLISLLLVEGAKDIEGEIALNTAIRARNKGGRDTDQYYLYVKKDKDLIGHSRANDPSNMTEAEIIRLIEEMKKEMGLLGQAEEGPATGDS